MPDFEKKKDKKLFFNMKMYTIVSLRPKRCNYLNNTIKTEILHLYIKIHRSFRSEIHRRWKVKQKLNLRH